MRTSEGHEYQDGRTPNSLERDLHLARPDGVGVSILEWNSPAGKDAELTRDAPPFSVDELTAWADGDQWSTEITQERADAAASLFRPVDLDAPAKGSTSASSAPATAAQRRRNCALARQAHRNAPGYCRTRH